MEKEERKQDAGFEEYIAEWRSYLRRRPSLQSADIEELEDHLRLEVTALGEMGLKDDEAFLVAVKRLGDLDTLSREFAREYSERLWKQLVVSPAAGGTVAASNREALVAVGFAIAAAIAIRIPELFGLHLAGSGGANSFYLRNFSLFVLPLLAFFFAWRRKLDSADEWRLAAPFILAAFFINVFPFQTDGHTERLAALHLPIALWLALGFAYVGGRWRDHDQRMNFIRFSGEWFIYYTLIALGGGVLIGCTVAVFEAIGLKAEPLIESWVLPCGVVGAVIIAAWLVEAKQSVIENMAPVLTRLFTPLFTIMLLVFLGTMLWTGSGIDVRREVLITFDLLLVVVLGLILYSISARDPMAPPGFFDGLQLLLVTCALLVDAFALWAIAARISEFGFSPNRVAALGENLVLLVNLAWSAFLYARLLKGRATFQALERWQTRYLPVYAIWAWIVVVIFPRVFGFQ
ncbi:MAG: hypothetical protein JSU96_18150 [Acidobacteriota bacterium]|nr:MAG: hypothetical protein JSU96_18150 [Acidobacteriota bacterium]